MTIKTTRTPNPHRRKIFPLPLSPTERSILQALANKYAGGNFSARIRHAALSYLPKERR